MVQKIIEKVKAECKAQGEDVDRRGYTKHYSSTSTSQKDENAATNYEIKTDFPGIKKVNQKQARICITCHTRTMKLGC